MIPQLAKPEPIKRAKARTKRHESKVVKSVRQQCVERDGHCRTHPFRYWDDPGFIADSGWERTGLCDGRSEWAHLGEQKRFKTRGKQPEERHTTSGSLMLCTKHHRAYDSGRMLIVGSDANKPLRFEMARE